MGGRSKEKSKRKSNGGKESKIRTQNKSKASMARKCVSAKKTN